MDNLKFWNSRNQPPKSALKEIQAGRMKGQSDINPQWRYKAMTEAFGVVGIGWKFTIDKMWTEQAANNEVMAFVCVSVYIKDGDKWSDAIPGNGGSTLIVSEKNGMYNDNDAYKKATTDALSTSMKMLGVAADVYMGMWDGAKYKDAPSEKKTEPITLEQALEFKTAKGTPFSTLDKEQLKQVAEKSPNKLQQEAARVIIEQLIKEGK